MVVHQNPCVQPGSKPLWQLPQEFQEMFPVPIITENGPPFIAARRHMIPASGPLNS